MRSELRTVMNRARLGAVRLAFIVADVRAQQPSWTTTYLAQAALARGHEVSLVAVDELTLRADNSVTGRMVRPAGAAASNAELCAALAERGARVVEETLQTHDVVFLRYHPYREGRGLATPAIDFGWRLRLGGALVVNDPEGTQRAGGRMYLTGLPAEIRPRLLVTRDTARVKAFLKELDAPAVVKPLAEQHAGADNVFYLARGQVKNLNQILTVVRRTGYLVVQEYLPEVKEGEKRLLLLAGEPIRGGEGDQVAIYRRAGSETGGARKKCEFGAAEQRIVELLRPRLEADGLYFVGIDIVGSKVLEVNVYTPGGAHANLSLSGIDVAGAVVRDLERRVEARQAARRSA